MSKNKKQLELKFCESCNAEHKTATLLTSDLNNQVYCEDCYYERHILCGICYHECLIGVAHVHNSRHLCDSCYYVNCYECEDSIGRDDAIAAMGQYYCQDCYDNNILSCERCDVEIYSDDSYSDEGGCILCEHCYNEDDSNNDNRIIKHYEFVPELIYYNKGAASHFNTPACYLGIELEVENSTNKIDNDEMALKIGDLINNGSELVYFKRDGSLENGFEIVTHPCIFEHLVSIKPKINKMLKLLIKNGFVSWDSIRCGMHVHISSNFLKQDGYIRMLDFFDKHNNFIRAISHRTVDSFQQWCNHVPNRFVMNCKEGNKKKRHVGTYGKYSALNLKRTTCEMRIFKGTLLSKSFWRNVEFAASMAEFAALNKRSYFKYLIDNEKRFQNLYNDYTAKRWSRYEKKLVY